jgi:hypothetical protein
MAWWRKTQRSGKRDDSSAPRDHTRTTAPARHTRPADDGGTRCPSRMHHQNETSAYCWLALLLHLLASLTLTRARCLCQREVSSSPPPKARPARPRSRLAARVQFFRPSSAAFPLANLLPHPRSARLLLQPYQLRLSFHYTLIPAHVPAFPSSQPCAAYRRSG